MIEAENVNPSDCYENIYILSDNGDANQEQETFFNPLHPAVIQEIGEEDLISPIPSPQPPAEQQHQHRVHKNVNYFNHKFVISETEDISVDKLISLSEKPVEMVAPSDPQKFVQCKENRAGNGKKFGTLLPRGESILRNFDNHKNIPVIVPTTMPTQPLLSPCHPPTPSHNVNTAEITQKPPAKVFVVEKNTLKPIIAPSNVASGIFRSTNPSSTTTMGKKRKLDHFPPPMSTETNHSPKNILILNSTQGKIVPMSDIEEIQNMQQQSVAGGNIMGAGGGGGGVTGTVKNGNNHQTVQITNGGTTAVGKTGETKQINRRLIKIPLSAFQSVDQTNGGSVAGDGGAGDKNGSKNLVLNIVNMVANNPEITQRTEINHR